MDQSSTRPAFIPAVFYRDPSAALDWLERAFGFERLMVITEKDGRFAYAELRFGDGVIMLGTGWADFTTSPQLAGGKNTQAIHVQLDTDIDAHCDHAQAAGAAIVMAPQDQFYGDRSYRVRDLEGHVWTFSQNLRAVSREEAEQASGLTIEGWA